MMRPLSYGVQVQYTLICMACGSRDEQTYTALPTMPWPLPSIPDAWMQFGTGLFCAKHRTVELVCDGARLTILRRE